MTRQPTLELRPLRTRAATPGVPKRAVRRDRRTTREYPRVQRRGSRPQPGGQRFGEWLVHRGVLTRAALLRVLATSHLHEWRIGDAVVVLRLASRARVEAEAERFEIHTGRYETCSHLLERAEWIERESQIRRIKQAISGGARRG